MQWNCVSSNIIVVLFSFPRMVNNWMKNQKPIPYNSHWFSKLHNTHIRKSQTILYKQYLCINSMPTPSPLFYQLLNTHIKKSLLTILSHQYLCINSRPTPNSPLFCQLHNTHIRKLQIIIYITKTFALVLYFANCITLMSGNFKSLYIHQYLCTSP